MPSIYGATFQPFTYEELATPLREATVAHQNVEEDYNNNMLIVDSLRQRAANELETNPESKWAAGVLNYADQLEQYAGDLARNGLTRETRYNLMNMKRGYGTTVSPVLMAMQREKELQTVRDKNPGVRNVFSRMPSIDEIIANPNADQNWYSGEQVFSDAQALANAASKREVEWFSPQNINAFYYKYGKKTGFSNEELTDIENNSIFAPLLQRVYDQFGWNNDAGLTDQQRNQLKNEAISGMLAGVQYDEDWHFNQRKDDPLYWLNYQKAKNPNPSGYGNVDIPTTKRSNLIFGNTIDPRQQNDNNEIRNMMINNKKIVTGVKPSINGNQYEISNDYINKMFEWLNRGRDEKVIDWVRNPVRGRIMDIRQNSFQELVDMVGITKDDTIESAKQKLSNWLQNDIDYTDLADATLHTSLQIKFDPSDYGKIRDNYTGEDSNRTILKQDKDGRWMPTNKTIENIDKYNPVRVDLGLNGPIQIWLKNDSKEDGDDVVVTPFFNKRYGDEIGANYSEVQGSPVKLTRSFNDRNNLEAQIIRNTIDYNINQFDNDILKRATGYTKGDIMQFVKQSQNSAKSNRNLVELMNTVEQRYYAYQIMLYQQKYQNGQFSEDDLRDLQVSQQRLNNVNDKIQFMEDMINEIDEALSSSKQDVMDIIGITAKTQPEQYGGGDFRN